VATDLSVEVWTKTEFRETVTHIGASPKRDPDELRFTDRRSHPAEPGETDNY
jgi:hypothetical protein